MISKLYENITSGLKEIESCEVYQEVVPENVSLPFFLVSICSQKQANGLNGRYKNQVDLDVMYFPESSQAADAIRECWKMGEALNWAFRIPEFKMMNRSAKVTDKVLHYTFTIPYRTTMEEETVKMQTMSQSTELKEE